jgi:hypothetical protein
MKRTLFAVIIICFCFSLFINCKKEGKDLGPVSFTAQDLQIIPYKGGEIVFMLDSLGDTLLYTLGPRWTGYYDVRNDSVQSKKSIYENYYNVEMARASATGGFDITLSFSDPFVSPIEKYFTINTFNTFGMDSAMSLINPFTGKWGFDAGKLFALSGTNSSPISYYDTLTIINKTFYSVYGLSQILNSSDSLYNTISTVYYSVQQGFVGVQTSQGYRFCLINSKGSETTHRKQTSIQNSLHRRKGEPQRSGELIQKNNK